MASSGGIPLVFAADGARFSRNMSRKWRIATVHFVHEMNYLVFVSVVVFEFQARPRRFTFSLFKHVVFSQILRSKLRTAQNGLQLHRRDQCDLADDLKSS